MTQKRKQTPTLLIKITQEIVILNLEHPMYYSSTNIALYNDTVCSDVIIIGS